MKHTVTKLYYYIKTVIQLTTYLFLFTGYKVKNTLPNTSLESVFEYNNFNALSLFWELRIELQSIPLICIVFK